jgi:hypothetical protein
MGTTETKAIMEVTGIRVTKAITEITGNRVIRATMGIMKVKGKLAVMNTAIKGTMETTEKIKTMISLDRAN